MLENQEDVARIIFSPKMIHEGRLIPAAFELRPQIKEDYLSVLRTSISTWKEDIHCVPERKNRRLSGYALLNVSDIHTINVFNSELKVMEYDNEIIKSHAGIFTYINGKLIVAGETDPKDEFILLSIRRKLTDLAQSRFCEM